MEIFFVFLVIFLIALVSYLVGSIPTGYLIVKAKTGEDIRDTGSGSIGATNVKRILGTKWFVIVLILDVIKGMLPVLFTKYVITDTMGFFEVLSAGLVVLGHSKPVFLQFRGGKSVASGIGTLIVLNPFAGLATAVIWALVTFISKYVSVGSIIAVLLSPALMYFFKGSKVFIIYCVLLAAYVFVLHWPNVQRLMVGEENKIR